MDEWSAIIKVESTNSPKYDIIKTKEGEKHDLRQRIQGKCIKIIRRNRGKKAADQLGLPYYTIAEWRKARTRYGPNAIVGSGNKRLPLDPNEQRILELERENMELRHANEILQEALGFFAKNRKK